MLRLLCQEFMIIKNFYLDSLLLLTCLALRERWNYRKNSQTLKLSWLCVIQRAGKVKISKNLKIKKLIELSRYSGGPQWRIQWFLWLRMAIGMQELCRLLYSGIMIIIGVFSQLYTVRELTNEPKRFNRYMFAPNGCTNYQVAMKSRGVRDANLMNRWTAHIQASIPAERLLIFESKEGWAPLCKVRATHFYFLKRSHI